jgi:hypothetical protein
MIITLMINTPGDRSRVIARRDVIVSNLTEELGLRVSMYDNGLDVYLVDEGIATVGDVATGQAEGPSSPPDGFWQPSNDRGDHVRQPVRSVYPDPERPHGCNDVGDY